VWLFRVAELVGYDFQTILHFGDADKLMTSLGAPGSTGDKSGSFSNHSRAVWEQQRLLWERGWFAWKSQLLIIVQQFVKLM